MKGLGSTRARSPHPLATAHAPGCPCQLLPERPRDEITGLCACCLAGGRFWQACEGSSQSTCSWGVCRLTLLVECRLPRFPCALSDPWTCPGLWPPLFAVIRAMKRIGCLKGVGPQASLAKHERFQRKRQLSQPDPAKRIWEVQATFKTQPVALCSGIPAWPQPSLLCPHHSGQKRFYFCPTQPASAC